MPTTYNRTTDPAARKALAADLREIRHYYARRAIGFARPSWGTSTRGLRASRGMGT